MCTTVSHKNCSIESLRKVSAHCVGPLDYVDAYVWLAGPRDPAPMARVPKGKFSAQMEGEKAHSDKAIEKKPESVEVDLGQVTRGRAKAYGFNYAKWKAMVEAATTVNLERIGSPGKLVGGVLSAPVSVRVKADNGTDLGSRLAGETRKAHVFDGVIGEEGLAVRTAGNRYVSLPAGLIAIAPVEASAEGTFVSDVPTPQRGRLVEGISWTFRDGRVMDFTAKRNLPMAQTNWEEASGAKDMFGGVCFGLNPKAQPRFLQNSIMSGCTSLRIGDDRDLGGTNDSSYSFLASLARGTVEVGGKKVIEDGKWIV